MSKNNGVSLPHPVLGNGNDVEGSFSVNIIPALEDGKLKLIQDGDVLFTNDYFKSLSDSGKINTSFKIISQGTLYANVINGFLNETIDCSQLSWKIEIETYLVAIKKIDDYGDPTFNEDFMVGDPNRKFEVEEGMIVGFGGSISVIFDTVYLNSVSGIIEFSAVSEDQPVSFDTDGPKIIIKYPKKEGENDIVTVLSQKTSRFKETFLNIFILPALSAAYDALKKAENESVLNEFIDQHTWAYVIDTLGPEWDGQESFILAQRFLQSMIQRKRGTPAQVPVINSFEELQNSMNR
jgi:hypothetical protein